MILLIPDLTDEEVETAKYLAIEKPSTSYIQRRMRIGYNQAKRLMARLEADGIVSAADTSGRRTVIWK